MEALIIKSKNSENLKLLAELAKKLGDSVKPLSMEDSEDLIFGEMIDKAKTGEYVSKEAVISRLARK